MLHPELALLFESRLNFMLHPEYYTFSNYDLSMCETRMQGAKMSATSTGSAAIAILLVALAAVAAEEAVDRTGKRHAGRLHHDGADWTFRDERGTPMPLGQIAYVRFEVRPTPAPKAPPLKTLLLPLDQRVTGALLSLDDTIRFTTTWGQAGAWDRARVLGIVQAGDAVVIHRDDFETDLKAWRIAGNARLDRRRAFFGKSSLLLDAKGQSAQRDWQPAAGDGDVRLFFFDAAKPATLRWSISARLDGSDLDPPAFVLDKNKYSCTNAAKKSAPLAATAGWHLLAFELRAGRLRVFVNDYCLGETAVPARTAFGGLRASVDKPAVGKDEGEVWIDELIVSRPLAPLPAPPNTKDQDALWLEAGEQPFGRIVSADANAVILDARFGKRSIAWSKLRGILFAQAKGKAPIGAAVIAFRPAPGLPPDRLRAKLLRWENANLIVRHDLFGEFAIERDRLDTIRFDAHGQN